MYRAVEMSTKIVDKKLTSLKKVALLKAKEDKLMSANRQHLRDAKECFEELMDCLKAVNWEHASDAQAKLLETMHQTHREAQQILFRLL
jgi:sugar-specific transcriptional regulator TrmB